MMVLVKADVECGRVDFQWRPDQSLCIHGWSVGNNGSVSERNKGHHSIRKPQWRGCGEEGGCWQGGEVFLSLVRPVCGAGHGRWWWNWEKKHSVPLSPAPWRTGLGIQWHLSRWRGWKERASTGRIVVCLTAQLLIKARMLIPEAQNLQRHTFSVDLFSVWSLWASTFYHRMLLECVLAFVVQNYKPQTNLMAHNANSVQTRSIRTSILWIYSPCLCNLEFWHKKNIEWTTFY